MPQQAGLDPAARDARGARAARRAVTLAFLANGLAIPSLLVRVPDVRDLLALREATLGLALSGLAVGVITGLVLAGVLARTQSSRRLTLGGATAMLLILPLAGLASHLILLILVALLLGTASATMDVGMNALGVGVEARYRRSLMLGFHGAWSVGALLAALAGSLAMGAGVPVALHLAIVSVVILAAVVAAAPALPVEDRTRVGEGPRFALPRGPLLPLALVALAAGLGESTGNDWSGIHLADELSVGPGRVGWGLVALTASMTVVRLTGDRVVRRVGPARVVTSGGALAAAGFLTVAVSDALPVTLGAFAAVGAGVGVSIPLVFAAAGAQADRPGQGVAAVATVGYAAFVLAPPTVGLIADLAGLRVAFALVALLIAVLTLRPHPALAPPAAASVSANA